MKPLKLIMSAFGPFRKLVEVPFDEFGQNGLFLVTGDTGAGKTTIFDAISFALFGNASGENRTADCFRSDFADSEEKTFVELTFYHRDKIYRVMRNPLYVRSKRKGDGTTQEKANATLTMPDGSIISGYNPVTEAIINLLGIDWKQYKQIAMIAQGEFLQLLTANSTERGIIFRKVFGTQIYDEIQRKLKGMAAALKYRCEDIDKSILQYLNGIVCDETNEHFQMITEWKGSQDIHQVDKIIELLAVLVDTDKQRYKSEHRNSELLKSQIKEKSIEHANAVRMNQKVTDLMRAREEYTALQQAESEMQRKDVFIQAAKKALYTVKPIEDIYIRLQRERDKLDADILQLTAESNKQKEDLKAYYEIWIGKEAEKPRIIELTARINRQEEELFKYDSVTTLEEEKVALMNKRQLLEQRITEHSKRRTAINAEQDQIRKEQETYVTLERDLLDCQNQLEQHSFVIRHLHQLSEDYDALRKEMMKLCDLQSDFHKAEDTYRSRNTIYLETEAQFLREQAGILAASLQEGKPCPVCGSEHHPKKAVLNAQAPSEEQLRRYKSEAEEAHQGMLEAGSLCNNQSTRTVMLKDQLFKRAAEYQELREDTLTPDTLKDLIQAGLEREKLVLSDLKNHESDLISFSKRKLQGAKRLTEITEELSRLEEAMVKDNDDLTATVNLLSMAEGRLTTLRNDLSYPSKKEALEALEADRLYCRSLQEALTAAEHEYRSCETKLSNLMAVLEDNKRTAATKDSELTAEKMNFEEKLEGCGFDNIASYKDVLLDETQLNGMVHKLEAYRKDCDLLLKSIEQLELETCDFQTMDISKILAEQAELEQQKLLSEERMQVIYSRLEMNSSIHHYVWQKYKEQESMRQEYMMVNDLSKTANGELSGKAKIAFEQYVQAFYFNSVINEANKRLYRMSNNQFTLLRKDDPSNLRSASGLELEIMDYYTGKARSIKSLSGGESFKAALALALGLSDVIQSFAGGIRVDAMFIDEGFGSLDSNSLEQAIETLNALTSGNRIVGIISHVSELKERIDNKIAIEKNMEGSRLTLIHS